MQATLFAPKFSKADFLALIKNALDLDVKIIKVIRYGEKLMNVVYKVGKTVCARFVSRYQTAKQKLLRTIERSKEVEFIGNSNTTINFHVVTLASLHCTCENYKNDEHVIYISGQKICKHLIADASRKGFNTLSKFSELIKMNSKGA